MGDKVAEDLPDKAEIVEEGQVLTLASIDLKILHESDGEEYDVEIPVSNAVYCHVMWSRTHNILPAIVYIEAEIAELKCYHEIISGALFRE